MSGRTFGKPQRVIAAYVIVLPLLCIGAGLGAWQVRVVWREAARQLEPGSDLRAGYRRNWAVGTRSRRRWLTIAIAFWVLVTACLALEFALRPFWYFAVWIGLVAMGWTAVAVVCTVQGVRARKAFR